jgi:hypothetical protein
MADAPTKILIAPAVNRPGRFQALPEGGDNRTPLLTDNLGLEEWLEIGRSLTQTERDVQWRLGDWWAFGNHRYGERANIAAGTLKFVVGTLQNYASVARKFPPSRRREDLSFSHHVEVAVRSSLVWIKPQMGIGNYWRNSHEILLTAIRGNAKGFNDRGLKSWILYDRGAHSAKPEEVRSYIERASPPPYLELFGRRSAPNWTVWGNQIERTIFDAKPREGAELSNLPTNPSDTSSGFLARAYDAATNAATVEVQS